MQEQKKSHIFGRSFFLHLTSIQSVTFSTPHCSLKCNGKFKSHLHNRSTRSSPWHTSTPPCERGSLSYCLVLLWLGRQRLDVMNTAPLTALITACVPTKCHPTLRVQSQRRQDLSVISIREVRNDFHPIPLSVEKLSVVDGKLQGLKRTG